MRVPLGRFGKRYQRYRFFFFLSFILFLTGVLLSLFWFGLDRNARLTGAFSWQDQFPLFFVSEALWYLAAFLLGITVYAPAFQILASFFRGLPAGILLGAAMGALSQKGAFLFFLLLILYLFFEASLFSTYSSFCTLVALRLFTDAETKNVREEEKRMFGGSLFNSTFFRNTVNLRFLSMYILFFFAALLLCSGLNFVFVFFRSFFG